MNKDLVYTLAYAKFNFGDPNKYQYLYALTKAIPNLRKALNMEVILKKIGKSEDKCKNPSISFLDSQIYNTTLYKEFMSKIMIFSSYKYSKLAAFLLFITSMLDTDVVKDKASIYKLMKEQEEIVSDAEPEVTSKSDIEDTRSLLESFPNVIDMSEIPYNPVIAREKEIEILSSVLLRKRKNNVVLLGEPGVGKTALVHELARRLKYIPYLSSKKIWMVNASVSDTEAVERLANMLYAINSIEDLIFIDELHSALVPAVMKQPIIYALKYIATNKSQIIASTTNEDYNKIIMLDRAFKRRFHVINLQEFNPITMMDVLDKLKYTYEFEDNIIFSDEALKWITFLTHKYINNSFPDKAIDLMEDIVARVKFKYYKITPDTLHKIIKKGYPFYKVTKQDVVETFEHVTNTTFTILEKNKHYGNLLIDSIVDENSNINNIFNSKISSYFVIDKSKGSKDSNEEINIKSLITNIKNVLVEQNKIYSKMITIDGYLFTEPHTISRLTGTSQGYIGYDDNTLLDPLFSTPKSIIIVKLNGMHRRIVKFFSDILAYGEYVTNKGVLSFKSALFIFIYNMKEDKDNKSVGFIKNEKSKVSKKENEGTQGIPEDISSIMEVSRTYEFKNSRIKKAKGRRNG